MATIELKSALDRLEPVTVRFSDGREFEFPADVDAATWLAFNATWGDQFAAQEMPPSGIKPFYRMVMGDRLDDLLSSGIAASELRQVAMSLYLHYFLLGSEVGEEGDDEDPPVKAAE